MGKLQNLRKHNIFSQEHALRGLQLLGVIAAFLAAFQVAGCYYMQAAGGQMEILRKRTPIDEVIENPDTPEQLKSRLEMVQSARRFAVDELLLPDNESYQTFADLERDYVVWNVMAALRRETGSDMTDKNVPNPHRLASTKTFVKHVFPARP